MKLYAKFIYDIIKEETQGLNAVYEDYIVMSVGLRGLTALTKYGFIESCGIINGRQMYAVK